MDAITIMKPGSEEGEMGEPQGLATISVPKSSLPEGITAGATGRAMFTVGEDSGGDSIELTITSVEPDEAKEEESYSGDDELEGSLSAAMSPQMGR